MRQLPAMALLHNDRAVLTKTKYAEYAAKNSLVNGGKSNTLEKYPVKADPRFWTSVLRKSKRGGSFCRD